MTEPGRVRPLAAGGLIPADSTMPLAGDTGYIVPERAHCPDCDSCWADGRLWHQPECPSLTARLLRRTTSRPALSPEVAQAMEQARVTMRANVEQMLAEYGLTPEQITEFMAEIDKAGEELHRATSLIAPARNDR